MAYLVTIMWVCLALAALLGLLLGFLLTRFNLLGRLNKLEQSWTSKLRQTEQDRDTRVARLTTELEDHRSQIPTLEGSLAERSELIASLESDVLMWKEKIPDLETRLESQLQINTEVNTERDKIKSELKAAVQEQQSKGSEFRILQNELNALRDKHNTLNTSSKEADKELERLQQLLGSRENEVESTSKELEKVRQELSNLASTRSGTDDADKHIAELTTELSQLRVRENDLSSQLEKLNIQLSDKSAQNEGLQNQIRSQEQKAKELEQSLAESKSKSDADADLNEQMSIFRTQINDHEAELEGLRRKAGEWQQKYQNLQTESATGEQKLKQFENELTEWEGKYTQLSSMADLAVSRQQELEKELEVRQVHLQKERDNIGRLKEKLSSAEANASNTSSEREKLESSLRDARKRQAGFETEAGEWRSKHARLETESTGRIENLKSKLGNLQNQLAETESSRAAFADQESELVAGQKIRRALERKLQLLDESLVQQSRETEDWKTRYQKLIEDNRTASRKRAATTKEAKPKKKAGKASKKRKTKKSDSTVTTKSPSWLLSKAPKEKDDLQEIWGVGPVMEKTLNKLGVYLYRQVASLRKKDIQWIASHINTFPDRIERDDWVSQARELRIEKYGR